MEVSNQLHPLTALPPDIHWIIGWVGSGADLDLISWYWVSLEKLIVGWYTGNAD
jgi:TM2 domain-containing membrane protein YozV